ncbi:MAG: Efflux ABC transporter, ATP-binding protein, partial [uncultured Gemmatimonadetes bacterium]
EHATAGNADRAPGRSGRRRRARAAQREQVVRQRGGRQRHHLFAGCGHHRPAGAQRRRQEHAAAHDVGVPGAVGGRGAGERPPRLEESRDVPGAGAGSRARDGVSAPDRLRVRPGQRAASRIGGPRGRRGARDRHRGPAQRDEPPHRHVQQGNAAARQDRRGAGPRSPHPAAGRAVQRHGPHPAHADDGSAEAAGGGGAHDPDLVAHPGGAGPARQQRAGGGFREAGGFRPLPRDPPADDGPAPHLQPALQRRPAPGVGAGRPSLGARGGARRAPERPRERPRLVRPGAGRHRPGRRGDAVRAAAHRRVAGKRLQLPGEAM